jgi:hypothetical protein
LGIVKKVLGFEAKDLGGEENVLNGEEKVLPVEEKVLDGGMSWCERNASHGVMVQFGPEHVHVDAPLQFKMQSPPVQFVIVHDCAL